MSYRCAWCWKSDATRKVAIGGDDSTEGYRYFCNTTHQANWETNQPRPVPVMVPIEAASFLELVKQANLDGWILLNFFQNGFGEDTIFRVNLQKRRPNGATTDYFSDYREDANPHTAMVLALRAARAIDKQHFERSLKHGTPDTTTTGKVDVLTTAQEKRLDAVFQKLFFAVKMNGTGSGDRASDL